MQTLKKFLNRHNDLVFLFLIILITLLTYLPSMKGAGFYGDDYHIVYGAYTSGVDKLIEIAKIDRPFHGITFSLYFPLFGFNIHAYQIFELCLNILTAFLAYWIICTVWPRMKSIAFITAVLLSIYPGYTDHMRSFNYCLFMLNLFLYILSIALTIKTKIVKSRPLKGFFLIISIFTFLWAVLINEYYIGLEVLRLGIISVLLERDNPDKKPRKRLVFRVLMNYLPLLIAGIGFLIWRFFIFNNQRGATNLGAFTSGFVSSPFYASVSILRGLITNFINISVLAWSQPFYQFSNFLRLKDFITCALFALIGALVIFFAIRFYRKSSHETMEDNKDWIQLLIIGGITIVAAGFPVVFADRNVTFDYYGRYALPGMLAGILFLLSIIFRFLRADLRDVLIGLLVFSGIFTQLGVGKELATDWQGSKDFWWQLSWRAPSLSKGTLLTGYSADYAMPEGFNLWAPANLIYYPNETNPVIFGETLNTQFIHNVLEDNDTRREFRSYILGNETEKLLVLSKPSIYSCLHLIDGTAPEYSSYDTSNIMLIGSYSNLGQVDVMANPSTPPKVIFGEEPNHGWCYYYQKSSLALQKGDYEEVVNLEEEAEREGLKPEDSSELVPFLLANAEIGNEEKINELLPIFLDNPFNKVNYCQNLAEKKYKISDGANSYLYEQSCP